MPVWRVSQPYISLWVQDEPLGYQPGAGPRVAFQLAYKQRDFTAGADANIFGVGRSWNCSWLSWASLDANNNPVVLLPGGGQIVFQGEADYLTNIRISGDTNSGFTLSYPDGSADIYGFIAHNADGAFLKAFLTEHWNAHSQKTSFGYHDYTPANGTVALWYVVDGDGGTNWISYVSGNWYSTNLISQVVDRYGRTTSLSYDWLGRLINITDVVGISTDFTYDGYNRLTSMTTPYGTTTFGYTETSLTQTAPNGRSVLVTEPDGSHQLYLYEDSAPGVPTSYPSGQVPTTSPFANTFDNSQLHIRNSFHWGRSQYAALSTTDIPSFTAADFRKAALRHWLNAGPGTVGETLSLYRDPSPDSAGSNEGQLTWYDYAGKSDTASQGSQVLPLFVACVLPDGTTRFNRTDHNSLGYPTAAVSTYSAGASLGLRTNVFAYADNGIDLLTSINALGVQVASNSFNTSHQVLTHYNALVEMTVFAYNGNHQLTTVSRPNGLVSSYMYFGSGDAVNRLSQAIDYAVLGGNVAISYRTNTYTWGNGLVLTHTDPRGLTVTSTWDSLQRLRRADYPDGTFITNAYDKLDLVQVVDRMGFPTSYGYNAVRQRTAATNANGTVTLNSYCSCGSLESITNAFGSAVQAVTRFSYDNQGNLIQTVGPDNYSVTYNYNALGQMTNVADTLASATNWYNNQGLRYAVSNAFGCVEFIGYDPLDRPTSRTDANGVTVNSTFDDLRRLLARAYPDGGVEQFGYTPNIAAVTSYTNQLGSNVVNLVYDPLGRKAMEMYAGVATNQFLYAPAGDLLTLTDGKNQTTTWVYDEYGRVTNKLDAASNLMFAYGYDADSRLTSRQTPAKGTTTYGYDAVGDLTNIAYPVSPAIALQYDAQNRLTTMLDGVGTTTYGYDAAGQLLSEDGPWADDTVSYTYNNRLRASMSLLAPSASAWSQSYGYDAARRLTSVSSPAGSFGYSYDPVRSLEVGLLTLPNGAFITNSYDSVSRLLSTVLKSSGLSTINSHIYQLNAASQRTQQAFTPGNYINYAYDNIGQLQTAQGMEAGGITSRLHEQFGYAYDAAGNLNFRTNNALVEAFAVNSLNELASETSAGTLTVAGTTTPGLATHVAVNGQAAVLYADATFAKDGFILAGGINAFTAVASDTNGATDTSTVTCYLPSPVVFSYDLNGSLASDGLRCFAYDDENQLTSVWVTNAWRSDFAYDGKMRRRTRTELTWNGSAWLTNQVVHYVYDGNLLIQERDANNLPQVTYTRGRDLSGGLQRAGGIGGLLARTDNGLLAVADSSAHAYYHADGSGNITCLVASNQVVTARYLYDPSGRLAGQWGPLADTNVMQFSSMPVHQLSGLTLYLFRAYDPNLQRWLSRDPIGELGGLNLYGYVGNNPVNYIDPLGLLTAVIIGLPTSSNPFGHAAIATTGNGVVSFGTGTQFGSDLPDYLNKQAAYRGSTVYVLNTTPEQEKAINDYLKTKKGKPINKYPDNCAHRTTEALEAGGVAPPDLTQMPHSDSFDLGGNVNGNWPSGIADALNDPGNLQISVPQGTTLPPNFLTGFNQKK